MNILHILKCYLTRLHNIVHAFIEVCDSWRIGFVLDFLFLSIFRCTMFPTSFDCRNGVITIKFHWSNISGKWNNHNNRISCSIQKKKALMESIAFIFGHCHFIFINTFSEWLRFAWPSVLCLILNVMLIKTISQIIYFGCRRWAKFRRFLSTLTMKRVWNKRKITEQQSSKEHLKE